MKFELKRKDKIGLLFFVAFVLSSSLIWLFEEQFDKELWRNEPTRRYKMVDHIIEQQVLMGKTKDEVIVLLGQPNLNSSSNEDLFLYKLGTPPSFFESKREQLLIVFANQKVTKVTIAQD